jgi:hypothetical protein
MRKRELKREDKKEKWRREERREKKEGRKGRKRFNYHKFLKKGIEGEWK